MVNGGLIAAGTFAGASRGRGETKAKQIEDQTRRLLEGPEGECCTLRPNSLIVACDSCTLRSGSHWTNQVRRTNDARISRSAAAIPIVGSMAIELANRSLTRAEPGGLDAA